MSDELPRAVLYLRQSTYREESISLELQEYEGRAYSERRGYKVVAVESDPGISGRTWKRPGVQRVMSMIEEKQADIVVLWKWSRLSRSRLDWAIAADKVQTAGGRIESATEPLDTTTSTGRLARGMLTEFAAFESERIGDVWKETIQRRIRKGLPGHGGDRYGYVRVEKDVYEPDPATAPVVAEAYRHYVDDEWGWTRMVKWLNTSGYRTITGTMWASDKIRGVLDAGFAAGVLATGYRTGKLTYHPGVHPPIIDKDLWNAYLARRALAPRPAAMVEPKSPLSGLMRCDDCGGTMRLINRAGGVKGYGCGNYLRTQSVRYVTCLRSAAETHVREWVFTLASDVEGLATAKAKLHQYQVTAINDSRAVEARRAKLIEQLGTLTIRYNTGKVSDAAYNAAAPRLEAELAGLDAREVQVSNRAEVDVRELVVSLAEYWDDMTNLELRTALSKVIREVRVIPPPVKKQGGAGPVTFRIFKKWEQVV